ncbi:hypothetical protein [Cesiribacter sp. SM1]|uniref:hypothetical protein n=1 Tax=Cesiribacter sp. SM1 TaxID=2861196 RepID=UPI001CD5B7FA|nr:hypothetical protein [Cesiribacter sp. SM1]
MKHFLLLMCLVFWASIHCSAQQNTAYKSLDTKNPIVFGGDYIIYQDDTFTLGPKAFFIDGQLTDAEVAAYPYVYNSVRKAAEKLTDGAEESPMVLYLAPYVYWIDDPDDPALRVSTDKGPPYGLVIKCEWLRFYGLTDKPENVVLASNRGQTIGAEGNFTMFKFIGQGTSAENVTFGNYCNVDLVYPLKPQLNRKKRATAIVQAQLIHCNGDKIVARNTHFISRLNLNPFVGGKRVLFDRCHFESTDDALCGTAVYLNCTLDFYSSKPFYHTTGTGAVFLNSDIRLFTRGEQYFTKVEGQLAVVDTRFTAETSLDIGWMDIPPKEMRNYQHNVSLNGKDVVISKNSPASTVQMAGKEVLDAYRFVHRDNVVYNTYNLLSGNDGWDPMGIREIVLAAEKEREKNYSMLPVQLLVSPTRLSVETGKNRAGLSAKVLRFGNFELEAETVSWHVAPEDSALVKLEVSKTGSNCQVIPTNTGDRSRQVIITAATPSGLEAASVIEVVPPVLDAPQFSSLPEIKLQKNGKLQLEYKLATAYADQSLVRFSCS